MTFAVMDSKTPSENVLSILELIQLIADNLSQHDLALCCLVNKTFNITFTPHLWHSITIHQNDLVPKFQSSEGRAGLLRNGHHIRVLRTQSLDLLRPFLEFGTTCTNLVSLDAQHSLYAPLHYSSNRTGLRSLAMRSRGRRGSAGTGQQQRSTPGFGFLDPPLTSVLGDATNSSEFGFESTSSATGFGVTDHALTNAFGGATIPSAIGSGYTTSVAASDIIFATMPGSRFGFTHPAPSREYSGASTSSALDLGYPLPDHASSGPLGSSQVSNATNLFSSGGVVANPLARAKATRNGLAEAVLVGILRRNPRLEFLVVPSHCMESEAVVKLAGDSLLLLKEFYSQDDLWARKSTVEFRLNDKSYNSYGRTDLKVRGFLRQPGGARAVSLLKNYPRLATLQLDIAARINDEELRKIKNADRELTCLQIHCGNAVGQACRQILMEATGLTSIDVIQYQREDKVPFYDTDRATFLKHALTLEELHVGGSDFDDETVLAILRACPLLKILSATGELHDYRPGMEAELNAPEAVVFPWACGMLESFECKITRVPRPDLVVTEIGLHLNGWVLTPPSQVPSHPNALQESRDLQRKVLKQLGQLTRLRTLSLGTLGYSIHEPIYSQLEIKGIRTMIVEEAVQIDCLELTLESGLDELVGLKDLEVFGAYQMAHRIGLPEVKWMVNNWPKLKTIHGLRYEHRDCDLRDQNGEEEAEDNDGENEVVETIVWIRENRPDIKVS